MSVWFIVVPLLILAVLVGTSRRRGGESQLGLALLLVIAAGIVAFVMLGGGK